MQGKRPGMGEKLPAAQGVHTLKLVAPVVLLVEPA
jgi:hypothetical protein